ncbi:MAG TPA: hypothetical protein PK156_06740, partial [Polyangium sp.]|nr:hypothetical protein [Polyangium sp.]
MPGSRHSSKKNNPQSHSSVDVVIFTAVKDELDAVLALGGDWQELRDRGGFRYHRREVRRARDSFTVAAAWIGEMGGQAAAMRGMPLLDELSPSCLAMCGICAGDPEKVALGDIIVANQLWPYGDGKQTADGFYHAMKLFPLDRRWGMDASFAADFIDLKALAESRPPTKERQTRWLLHALHAHQFDNGPAPADHTERKTSCPDYSTILKKALDKGLVRREGRTLALTNPGQDSVDEDALLYPDKLPCDKDFKVHVGAMATGSAVIEDPGIFRRLRTPNRHTIALDMEGAAIAELADRTNKQFLVVKAVQDFANGDKDDTFRAFGCRASAEFLFAFLEKHFEPENDRDDDERTRADIREFAHERGHEHPFLAKVERAAQARFPTAKMTKHRVEPPFVGLLQLEIETSGFSETQIVAALDQAITPELVKRFAVLERPFRDDYPPLRSTIVYRGDAAPSDLSVEARRKGIHLETFYAYQALFDLTKYLEWQTARLQADPIYPPAMYVDPPAT